MADVGLRDYKIGQQKAWMCDIGKSVKRAGMRLKIR